jgi:methyl-accepting chemotaxis protein
MRISTRLRTISTATTVGLAVMSALLAWTFDEFKRAENDKAVANTILVNFFERTSFRDQYFLYREERTRVQWEANKQQSDRLLEQARLQFEHTEQLQTLKRLRKYIDDTVLLFHRIVDNQRTLQTISGSKRHVYEELDRRLSSQLLLKAELVRDSATTLNEACSRQVQQTYQQLLIVTGVFAISVALLAILMSISLSKIIKRRLIPLHDGARIIAGGDLSHRIAFNTNDEFADLAQSINRMTDGLHAFTQRLEAEIHEHERTEEKLEELNLDFVSFLENTSDFI